MRRGGELSPAQRKAGEQGFGGGWQEPHGNRQSGISEAMGLTGASGQGNVNGLQEKA